jgi:hypothetical protein
MPRKETPIPEQLAELIRTIIDGPRGDELGDAFQHAGDHPPITRQSLSELDIHNIINNIKLRHDVNFDRDLSFRPNLDGVKGQEKLKASKTYWSALCAELELYTHLFYNSQPGVLPHNRNFTQSNTTWMALVQNAKKRIPILFETIREVLKSLVPDRDQSRVEEHLDVAMLMQEIEKGVCDLVRLSEWMSHLLKEHCAPMRDEWVDKMVEWTKDGVSKGSSESIVNGLRELLGILEAMKLDVANHQIRNLRGLLIEDTINFERNYHLGKIVQGRARVNLGNAQQWYSSEQHRHRVSHDPTAKDSMRVHLEVFVKAVVSLLLSPKPIEFPETFYLDHDRLQNLRIVLHDLVYFEICFTLFSQLLRRLGFHGSMSHSTRHVLRTSLSAILGDGAGHSFQQWMKNHEYISVELVRHALHTCGFSHAYDARLVTETTNFFHHMMLVSFSDHATALEESITDQIQSCVNSHIHSSPLDLFNALVAPSNPPPPHPPPKYISITPQLASDMLPPHVDQLLDITNRIAHIILLHWRTWGPIVYVIPDDDQATSLSTPMADPQAKVENTADHSHSTAINHLSVDESKAPTPVAAAAVGKSAGQDSQKETQFAGSAPEASPFE